MICHRPVSQRRAASMAHADLGPLPRCPSPKLRCRRRASITSAASNLHCTGRHHEDTLTRTMHRVAHNESTVSDGCVLYFLLLYESIVLESIRLRRPVQFLGSHGLASSLHSPSILRRKVASRYATLQAAARCVVTVSSPRDPLSTPS